MDSACFNSTDGFIYGVRGGRIFQLNPTTGAITNSKDFAPFGFGGSCCYDSGTNSVFASVWYTPVFNNDSPSNVSSPRSVYKITPSTLTVAQIIDIDTVLTVSNGTLAFTQVGVADLRSAGGVIYGRIIKNSGGAVMPQMGGFRFRASDLGIPATFFDTTAGYPKCAYDSVGDVLYVTDQQQQGFNFYNFGTATFTNGPMEPDATKIMLAIEFAQNKVFVSDQSRYIYVYNNAGVIITTLDTGDVNFNGVGIRYNSVDNLVYVAGGKENTVYSVNASTNALSTVKSGFDIPIDFVFTASKKFAVQAGAIPLKEVT